MLSFEAFAQSNSYPSTGNPIIYDYSPGLTLQRNTATGGFTQGIQTKLQNGDDNWFFGNLHDTKWMVAKGDFQSPRLVVLANGNVGVGTDNPQAKFEIQSPNSGWSLNSRSASPNPGDINGIKLYSGYLGDDKWAGVSSVAEDLHSNSTGLSLYSAQAERVRITSAGNVGVGTTTPENKLTIKGENATVDVQSTADGQTPGIFLRYQNSNIAGAKFYFNTGHAVTYFDNLYANTPGSAYGSFDFRSVNTSGNLESRFYVKGQNGNVGIGTTTPNEKLSVNGKIRAKEIKVETANWPDYVFEDDYKIASLTEIEKYIKENKHLPEMPSAKEAETNGVELGEMNKLLLKKVEELTLHLIKLNERLAELEKNNQQSKKN
jgi:hypothetical protein